MLELRHEFRRDYKCNWFFSHEEWIDRLITISLFITLLIIDENDFHFYLRHGNGTCSQHGEICSIWSHKRGNNSISNTIGNTILCDSNIAQLTYNSSYTDGTRYDTRLRFYTLQQDTNSFNTKYNYNSSGDTTINIKIKLEIIIWCGGFYEK